MHLRVMMTCRILEKFFQKSYVPHGISRSGTLSVTLHKAKAAGVDQGL